jgi:MarR family transcriptional regulator, organic hydroperoxide resistance regulator
VGESDGRAGPLPDVLQFMRVLWAIVHHLETMSKRMARDHGVTGPQRLVLRVIGLRPGLSAGELAAVLHLHPSTLTGVLRRLAAQGLVARSADALDRRRAVLRLTQRGRAANARRSGTVEADVRAALRRMAPSERRTARTGLEALAGALSVSPRRSPR